MALAPAGVSFLTSQLIGSGNPFSLLGFYDMIEVSEAVVSSEDPAYPFSNAYNYSDLKQFSPLLTSGTTTITLTQGVGSLCDYFAFSVHNGGSAGVSGTVEVDNGLGFEVVDTFDNLVDDKTYMSFFSTRASLTQRITFNHTAKFFVSNIRLGKAIVFVRPPNNGFQPGKYAPLDMVETSETYGQRFIVGRRVKRNHQEKGRFDFIEFGGQASVWFPDYTDHVLNSCPLYFKWNSGDDDAFFGKQDYKKLTKPSYVNSRYFSFSFDLKGYL